MPDLHGRTVCAAATVCSDMRPGTLAASCAEIGSPFRDWQHFHAPALHGSSDWRQLIKMSTAQLSADQVPFAIKGQQS